MKKHTLLGQSWMIFQLRNHYTTGIAARFYAIDGLEVDKLFDSSGIEQRKDFVIVRSNLVNPMSIIGQDE
jgi:hypothetical protein